MAKGIEALVNPKLLEWARKNSRLSLEAAAKKASIRPEQLDKWERGEGRPTINQVRKLAEVYKRPIALFYLSEPPKEFQALRDYRSLPGAPEEFVESYRLGLEIRRAWERRQIALELYRDLEEPPPAFDLDLAGSENPERFAMNLRRKLSITADIQRRFRDDRDAFNWWRQALEGLGVLVFQARDVEVSEMRGFSISERPLPVVVVNIKDSPYARIFTMLHEVVHVALRLGGLCNLEDEHTASVEDQKVEVFANRVAGAVLVPKQELLNEVLVQQKGDHLWSDDEIRELAKTYRVSSEVIVRRLLICGLTTPEFYQHKRAEFRKIKPAAKSGFAPPDQMVISTAGHTFIRLVLAGYYREKITSSDVSSFLNVNLKHMEKIERRVMGHSIEFGAVA